jgi:hypothetical protein
MRKVLLVGLLLVGTLCHAETTETSFWDSYGELHRIFYVYQGNLWGYDAKSIEVAVREIAKKTEGIGGEIKKLTKSMQAVPQYMHSLYDDMEPGDYFMIFDVVDWNTQQYRVYYYVVDVGVWCFNFRGK